MWELGDAAAEEDIALFTYPTAGYFDAFFYALLHEAMGNDGFQEALKYGEGIWDAEGAQATFDIIAKLAEYTESTTPANSSLLICIPMRPQRSLQQTAAQFSRSREWQTNSTAMRRSTMQSMIPAL